MEILKQGPSLTTTSSVPGTQLCGPTRLWKWKLFLAKLCLRSGSISSGGLKEVLIQISWFPSHILLNLSCFTPLWYVF